MEQPSTSSKWKRYIPVPANMLMIYVTHWPLSAYTTHVEIGNRYPMQAKHRYMKPKGRLLDFETISGNFWFSMEKWMTSRYHTLLLYPFCNVGNVNPWLYLLSFNIVPSTGIMSYWLAYFAGSIGGGLGKVLEYYYCYYKLYQIRDKRRKKFNFEQLAEDDLKQVFKDSNEFEEGSFEKGAINPHDYIDDKLLDKLFYTTNANQADFGPRLAINGLIGFSLAMSGHYLFKKLQQLFQKPLDGSNENDNEIIDGAIVGSIHDDDNIDEDMSLWSEIKGIVKDLFGQIRDYIGSTFTITAYHLIVFGFCSLQLSRNTYRYIQQNIHKRSEKGGYSYLNAGPGINGVDLGSLTSIFSGIMIYPFVLKIGEIWRWNKRVQSLKNNINNNINENNNNKHKDNNVNK